MKTETKPTYSHQSLEPINQQQEVAGLTARLKKMSTTDSGKLQLLLEAEAAQQQVIMKIRDLFLIQQGRVIVDFTADLSIDEEEI